MDVYKIIKNGREVQKVVGKLRAERIAAAERDSVTEVRVVPCIITQNQWERQMSRVYVERD